MTVVRPRTLEEAIRALQDFGASDESGPMVIAGGTDVMVEASHGHRTLGDVVAVRRVAELLQIRANTDEVRVGAALPYNDLTGPAGFPRESAPALWSAAASMGSTQIRGMGTLGGNVVTASPVGDSLCALLAIDARVTVAGGSGLRTVPIAELLSEGGGSTLAAGELLVDFHWSPASGPQRFLKVCRRGAVARSVVSVSMATEDGGAVRLVVGGCGPTPVRIKEAEALARGGFEVSPTFGADQAAAVADAVMAGLSPITDISGSADYRRHVAGVLVRRALTGFGREAQAA